MFTTERHPLEPFLPENTTLLMLGSFPPARKRWCMDFFYPNFTNDMWRIFGLCFHGDKFRFVDNDNKTYRRTDIEALLNELGVAYTIPPPWYAGRKTLHRIRIWK